jgi:hypothetical protein
VIDFLHNELAVDDWVVTVESGSSTSYFGVGQVVGFTPKMVKIQRPGWNSSTARRSDRLIKVDEEIILMYNLKK